MLATAKKRNEKLSNGLVLDSWALLAYIQAEPAGVKVKSLLIEAAENRQPLWISSINLGEVWYVLAGLFLVPDASASEGEQYGC